MTCSLSDEHWTEDETNLLQRIEAKGVPTTPDFDRKIHPDSNGCVSGNLQIASDLPEEWKKGIFTSAQSYSLLFRFSNAQGVAFKAFGVHNGTNDGEFGTQDFIFHDHTSTASCPSAADLARDNQMCSFMGATTPEHCELIQSSFPDKVSICEFVAGVGGIIGGHFCDSRPRSRTRSRSRSSRNRGKRSTSKNERDISERDLLLKSLSRDISEKDLLLKSLSGMMDTDMVVTRSAGTRFLNSTTHENPESCVQGLGLVPQSLGVFPSNPAMKVFLKGPSMRLSRSTVFQEDLEQFVQDGANPLQLEFWGQRQPCGTDIEDNFLVWDTEPVKLGVLSLDHMEDEVTCDAVSLNHPHQHPDHRLLGGIQRGRAVVYKKGAESRLAMPCKDLSECRSNGQLWRARTGN
jgi:hypothetical protein